MLWLLLACTPDFVDVKTFNIDEQDDTSVTSEPSTEDTANTDTSEPDCVPEAEVCDGIDNDCDGLIDDQDDDLDVSTATLMYFDGDHDGVGLASEAHYICELSQDYAPVAGDCDDSNPDIHPDAQEVCDGVDNNCDQVVDSADICPCDFVGTETGNYLVCEQEKSWMTAQDFCQSYNYNLITIDSEAEGEMFHNVSFSPWVWIGYNDRDSEGDWVWIGEEGSGFELWTWGEPVNPWSDGRDCATLGTITSKWYTEECDHQNGFICERSF